MTTCGFIGESRPSDHNMTTKASDCKPGTVSPLKRSRCGGSSEELVGDGSMNMYGEPAIRSKTGASRVDSYLYAQQFTDTIAWSGSTKNLVVYLTTVMHMGTAQAANFVTNWTGAASITPLVTAIIADSYWGRYWTGTIFTAILFHGLMLLTIAASLPELRPMQCNSQNFLCPEPSVFQWRFLYIALYVLALGGGAVTPINAFAANQFNEKHERENYKKSGFFNWCFYWVAVGNVFCVVLVFPAQENFSWQVGFGAAAAGSIISLLILFGGLPRFRFQRPQGNPFTRVAQVFVASVRNWWLEMPISESKAGYENSATVVYRHASSFKFLDKAAFEHVDEDEIVSSSDSEGLEKSVIFSSPSSEDLHSESEHMSDSDEPENKKGNARFFVDDLGSEKKLISPWKRCPPSQIEDVKCLLYMLPVFASAIIYATVFTQLSTLFLLQGQRMNRQIGAAKIPSASFTIFEYLSIIITVIAYDRVLVPLARKFTGVSKGFTDFQRIGIGQGISILAFVVAAIVEVKRLNVASTNNLLNDASNPVPMSAVWCVPQYVIMGASEVFMNVGLSEFFYDESPSQLRTFGTSLTFLITAFGNYGSTILITAVNRITSGGGAQPGWIPDNLNQGHLDRFFFLLAACSATNLLCFYGITRFYKSQQHDSTATLKSVAIDCDMFSKTGSIELSMVVDGRLTPNSSAIFMKSPINPRTPLR